MMKKRQVWFVLSLALAAALMVSACGRLGRAEDRATHSVIVIGRPQVTVENFNGDVQITTGPEGEVSADIVKYAASGQADRLEALTFSFAGDMHAVQARAAWSGAQDVGDVGIDLKIRVPEGSDVGVVLGNGSIRVDPGVGNIRVEAGNAEVTVRLAPEARFRLQAALGNGELRSDFDGVPTGRPVGPVDAAVGQAPLQALTITLANGTLALEKGR
jgi:hypothetical protein